MVPHRLVPVSCCQAELKERKQRAREEQRQREAEEEVRVLLCVLSGTL